MVGVSELSELVKICNNEDCKQLAKEFNELRGRALGRAYCDFTYECMQIIENCNNGKYTKEFLNLLTKVINEASKDDEKNKSKGMQNLDKMFKVAKGNSVTLQEVIEFAENNGWNPEEVALLKNESPRDKHVQDVLSYNITISEKINLLLCD